MNPSPFLEAGFAATVTACSASPETDGYSAINAQGWPFNIHPTATPDEWALLATAIEDGVVTVTPWAAPAPDPAKALADLRLKRDWLLDASDKMVMSDRPMPDTVRAQWLAYRQALRDLPGDYDGTGPAPAFPTAPSTEDRN